MCRRHLRSVCCITVAPLGKGCALFSGAMGELAATRAGSSRVTYRTSTSCAALQLHWRTLYLFKYSTALMLDMQHERRRHAWRGRRGTLHHW